MIISVENLKLLVKIGVTQEERAFPQAVEVCLKLLLEDSACTTSDDLQDTVDYVACCSLLEVYSRDSEWKLLEKMCADFCSKLLENFPLIKRVDIRATKNVIENAKAVAVSLSKEQD